MKFFLYADDTNVYMQHNNLPDLVTSFNQELIKLTNWIRANRLILNSNKTYFLLSHHVDYGAYIELKLDNKTIKKVDEVRFLGVLLDSRLQWKAHINDLKVKMSKITGVIYKVRDSLNISSLKQIYYSLVYPHLIYCAAIWTGANKTNLNVLELAQKRILRIINYKSYNDHTSPLFKEHNMLKFIDIMHLQTCVFVYKDLNGMSPSSVSCFSRLSHGVNTRGGRTTLALPQCRTSHAQSRLAYRGAKAWNSLNSSLTQTPSVASFKKTMKTKYIADY